MTDVGAHNEETQKSQVDTETTEKIIAENKATALEEVDGPRRTRKTYWAFGKLPFST